MGQGGRSAHHRGKVVAAAAPSDNYTPGRRRSWSRRCCRRAWRRRWSWWRIWGEEVERRGWSLVLVRCGRAGALVRVIPSAAAVHGWMGRVPGGPAPRPPASGCGSGVLSVSLSGPLVRHFIFCVLLIYASSRPLHPFLLIICSPIGNFNLHPDMFPPTKYTSLHSSKLPGFRALWLLETWSTLGPTWQYRFAARGLGSLCVSGRCRVDPPRGFWRRCLPPTASLSSPTIPSGPLYHVQCGLPFRSPVSSAAPPWRPWAPRPVLAPVEGSSCLRPDLLDDLQIYIPSSSTSCWWSSSPICSLPNSRSHRL
jgi:hypothetical protein